ncbi:MAG: Gldg family protein, partial [Candidatus Aminicenantaceae bacterium]
MDNIKKNLNYIGITLIFAAFVLIRIWPYKKTIPYILLGLGILSLLVYIYLNLSLLKQGMKRKSFLYSSNLFMMVILVIGILVLINYIFSRYHHRFDFTEAKVHSLSDQSVTVLKNLENEVRIKSFFLEGNYQRNTMQYLMDNYTYHTSKIKYEFIDPDKNPGLVKRYEVTEDGTSIFESGDKESRITSTSEEDITNAIIKISREKKKTIYFLEGHGEGSIE